MNTLRVEIQSLFPQPAMQKICQESQEYFSVALKEIKRIDFFQIKTQQPLPPHFQEIFYDPITQKIFLDPVSYDAEDNPASYFVEITYRPGVTDNSANTAKEALKLLKIEASVASGFLYLFYGTLSRSEVEHVAKEFLANELLQHVHLFSRQAFYQRNRFQQIKIPEVTLQHPLKPQEIVLDVSSAELLDISKSRCLALNLEEMQHIQRYFRDTQVQKRRQQNKLHQWPTDVEIEILAQTWSEHCKHKIFNSTIHYHEKKCSIGSPEIPSQTISSLYKTFIKSATREIEQSRQLDWLISVFNDNAGIVRFDAHLDLCIKVETHNSPSALDPYGGALTGILGVNRDILGCGKGARPIANTDIFCFAPPSWKNTETFLPHGLKHPRRILEGVHRGVEDGGNKSGIPTVNGAIFFDPDYAGKPLVFVGTVGVLPQKLPDGQNTSEKTVSPGDRVVMVGGAIGCDGIHGATFSSMELNESAPATAVQIGDPLTQKRLLDFLIEARDRSLYSSITDNGAGGLSSSVGEMARFSNGAVIDLGRCPVKYPGLSPYELMISESQERMTLAVPPQKLSALLELAEKRGVLATSIGEFNTSGFLSVYYHHELTAELPLEFLHDSLPPMNLQAIWDGPRPRTFWNVPVLNKKNLTLDSYENILLTLLASPNIASKESWVRRYDHEVQAATRIKPFCGTTASGPSDAGVLWLYPHGGERGNGVALGCGFAPRISLIDPYWMAQYAVDEALRNVIASGGDPNFCCVLDNFCWPDPIASPQNKDGDYKLGQLVRACHGLYDACKAYGTPLVSGKDSMKNDFRGKNPSGDAVTISILPTLLITAMAKVSIEHTVTTDFKATGHLIYLLGKNATGLANAEILEHYSLDCTLSTLLPKIALNENLQLYHRLFSAIQKNWIASCHDISDGGLLVAIAESMIGSQCGAELTIETESLDNFFWNESPGRFVVSISPEFETLFTTHFAGIEMQFLGRVIERPEMLVSTRGTKLLQLSLDKITQTWKRGHV